MAVLLSYGSVTFSALVDVNFEFSAVVKITWLN